MALVSDLMAFGMAGLLADLEGNNAAVSATAAGTSSTDATVLKRGQNFVLMTGTTNDGFRLPVDAPLMKPYFLVAVSGASKVYANTGGTLNGGSADAALSVTANKSAVAIRYSTLGWYLNVSA